MTPARRQVLGVALTLFSALTYSFYPSASRAVYAQGGNAAFMILVATGARAIGLSLYCLLKQKPLFKEKGTGKITFTGGFLQALTNIAIFCALAFMPGPIVITITFTSTLMLLGMLIIRGEVKASANNIGAALVSLLGVTIVLDLWSTDAAYQLMGIALAFGAALASAWRMYLYNHQLKKRDPIVVGAETFLIAFVFILPFMFFSLPQLPAETSGYVWAFAGCLSLIISSFAMFYGIAMIGSFQYSLMLKSEPIFTALLSAWLLNEVLSTSQYAGMGIVIASLAAYQLIDFKSRQRALKTP